MDYLCNFSTNLKLFQNSVFCKRNPRVRVLGRTVHEADLGFGRVREMPGKAGAVSVGTGMLGWGIFTLVQMDKLESSFEGNHLGRR